MAAELPAHPPWGSRCSEPTVDSPSRVYILFSRRHLWSVFTNRRAVPPDADFWAAAHRLLLQLDQEVNLSSWLTSHSLPAATTIQDHEYHQQKFWDDKVYLKAQQDLVIEAPLRDRVRLLREAEPHAGDWLRVVPNEHLGFRFGTAEYRLLFHFHLGLPLLPFEAAGLPCDYCGEAQDVYGDHAVACRDSGLWDRHNKFANALAAVSEAAGNRPIVEAQVAGRRRPADILIPYWRPGKDACVDFTGVHALNHSRHWALSLPAVEQAEPDKVAESSELCASAHMDFIPVGVDTFGAFGTQGRQFLGKLFHRYAKRQSSKELDRFPGQHQAECWQRVSVALRRGIASQLSLAIMESQSLPFPASPILLTPGCSTGAPI